MLIKEIFSLMSDTKNSLGTTKTIADHKMSTSLQNLAPLFKFVRFLGLAPYKLGPSGHLQRSSPYLILTGFIISLELFAGCWFIKELFATDSENLPAIDLILSFLNISINIVFSIYILLSGATTNFAACENLVRRMVNEETRILPHIPRQAKRRWITTIVIGSLFITATQNIMWFLNWDVLPLVLFAFSWKSALMNLTCIAFYVLVEIITKSFEDINHEIWKLYEYFVNEQNEYNGNDEKKKYVYTRENLLRCNHTPILHQRIWKTKLRIGELQMSHFTLQEICRAINKVFQHGLFFCYVLCVVSMVEALYYVVLKYRSGMELGRVLTLIFSSLCYVSLGASVAITADKAVAEGGDGGTVRAAAALLASARGIPDVEHQVQLFLLQLRASPVCFTVSGLFPLDLRFFVGLLGTIFGYFIVVVQLSAPSESNGISGLPVNCSCG